MIDLASGTRRVLSVAELTGSADFGSGQILVTYDVDPDVPGLESPDGS